MEDNKKIVLPNISEHESNLDKNITASVFIDNKNLTQDQLDEIIKQYQLNNNEKLDSYDDKVFLGDENYKGIKRYNFKRYHVPENTIVYDEHNELKIINPTEDKFVTVKTNEIFDNSIPQPIIKNLNKDFVPNNEINDQQTISVEQPSIDLTEEFKIEHNEQIIQPIRVLDISVNNEIIDSKPKQEIVKLKPNIEKTQTIVKEVENNNYHYIVQPIREFEINYHDKKDDFSIIVDNGDEYLTRKQRKEIERIEKAKHIEPIVPNKEVKTELFEMTVENSKENQPIRIIEKNIIVHDEYEKSLTEKQKIEYDDPKLELDKYLLIGDEEDHNLLIIDKEDEINNELINKLDHIQPNEQENDKPQKMYIRLADQSKEDKILLDQKSTLPERGIAPYYDNVDYAIEMIDIYKSFNNGKVIANNGITLRVKNNDVHAIIGENGAGKSVLMSILFGIYNADSGTIKVKGEEVVFSSAMDATLKGLGMVHQHFKLVETYSIYQNIILGCEDTNSSGFIKHIELRKKIERLNKRYNFNLDLNKKVSKLNVAEQQKTEILKLLYKDADILIFDEPTAVLSENEIKQFLEIVKQLKQDGKTIILITHKFNEIKEVADRATVIRLGTFISEFDVSTKSEREMINEMVGNEVDLVESEDIGTYNDEVIFEVNDLVLDEKLNSKPLNFQIHSGEIFAIAGVTGNGQSELALTIAGLMKNNSGKIKIKGKKINNLSIQKRYKSGLSYVPEDRHKYGIILDMPIYLNTVIDKIDDKPYSNLGFINNPMIKEYARLFIRNNDIRGTSRGTSAVRNLSGGNQQKLVIGREMDRDYDILVLEQPTRGLDLSAINNIHKEILKEKKKGKAVLLISYELDEIFRLADTVAVMNKYEIVDISNINDTNRDKIGKLMVGN